MSVHTVAKDFVERYLVSHRPLSMLLMIPALPLPPNGMVSRSMGLDRSGTEAGYLQRLIKILIG